MYTALSNKEKENDRTPIILKSSKSAVAELLTNGPNLNFGLTGLPNLG